jgi:hypothetical protein
VKEELEKNAIIFNVRISPERQELEKHIPNKA